MIKLGSAYVNIDGDDRKLDASFNRARGKTIAFGSVLQGILQGVGQRLFTAITSGVDTLVRKIGAAVTASSNLGEAINKTGVIFGDSAAEMVAWSKTSDKALGVSQRAALEAATGFGALFINMGQTEEQAAGLSKGLLKIAADLGSINNQDPTEVLAKLKSGLIGETEPIRSLNIFLNETVVASKAVELGLASSTNAVSDQAKVMARHALIVEQSAYALGDWDRTARDTANGARTLAAEFENGAARLGDSFRPAVTAIQNLLIDLAPQMFGYAQNITDMFASGLAAGIRAILPVIMTIRQLFSYWLKPGSPPRILPNLTKWGMGAMQAYLDGFRPEAARDALKGLGGAIESLLRGFVSTGQVGEIDLLKRVFGSREAIAAAVREFQTLGRVTATTMAEIVRQAGPAGESIGGLVEAYFDLQRASANVTKEQDKLNSVTQKYQELIDPISAELSANQAQQQALRDQTRVQDLRDQIADLGLVSQATAAAQEELDSLRAAPSTGNYFDDIKRQERILELEQEIADGKNATAEAELARLEIEEIGLSNSIESIEAKQAAEEEAAQLALDAAKAAEDAAQAELDSAQAVIELQQEQNRLIAEQIALNKQLEKERLDAIQKAADEAAKAQTDAARVEDAKFQFEFSTADTAGQVELLKKKLAGLEGGTVEYYQTLTQLADAQERYNYELENPVVDDATKKALALAEAQFQYNLAIADTPGQIALLNEKLGQTATDSVEYYQILSQIAGLEDSLAGEREAANAKAVSEAETLRQAQLQYELGIASTAEKLTILRGELATTTAGNADYYRILGQIATLEAQAATDAELNAGKVEEAQFQYNLAISDTATKIAMWKEKLAEVAPDSADYFDILTTIHGLQVALDQDISKIGTTDISAGLFSGVTTPLGESSAAGRDLAAAIGELNTAFTSDTFTTELPANVKRLADAMSGLFDAIYKVGVRLGLIDEEPNPVFFTTFADSVEDDTDRIYTAANETITNTMDNIEKLMSVIGVVTALINGDWREAWRLYKEYALEAYGAVDTETTAKLSRIEFLFDVAHNIWTGKWKTFWTDFGTYGPAALELLGVNISAWGPNLSLAISNLGTGVYNGGAGIIDQLWQGMQSKWGEVSAWFTEQLTALRNQLPFSEPKDPSSPLRGLAKSGAAILGMVQDGMQSASLSINPLVESLQLPAAGATNTSNSNVFNVAVTIQGNAGVEDVRKGVNLGLSDLMRSKGIKP